MTKGGRHVHLGLAGVDASGGPVLDEAVGEEAVGVLAEEDGLCVEGRRDAMSGEEGGCVI